MCSDPCITVYWINISTAMRMLCVQPHLIKPKRIFYNSLMMTSKWFVVCHHFGRTLNQCWRPIHAKWSPCSKTMKPSARNWLHWFEIFTRTSTNSTATFVCYGLWSKICPIYRWGSGSATFTCIASRLKRMSPQRKNFKNVGNCSLWCQKMNSSSCWKSVVKVWRNTKTRIVPSQIRTSIKE